jgi:hypothetical protein
MEPLLLACMCPDPRSGEGVKHSRASMRSKLNYLSGIGAAKMRVPEPQAILVHESLTLNSGRSPTSRVLDAVWETTESGAMINVLACHSQEIQRPLHGTGWPVTLSPTMVRTYGSTHAPISLLNSYREPRWLWSISALCWHVPRSPIVPSTNYRPRQTETSLSSACSTTERRRSRTRRYRRDSIRFDVHQVKLEQSDGRTDAQRVATSGYVCIVWKSRTG